MSGRRTLVATWAAYAAFYPARLALASAKPLLTASGVSFLWLGWFDAAFLGAYAVGQLVNGRLSDRVRPGRMIAVGLILSGLLCVAQGWVGFGILGLLVSACHGWVQSLGWAPSVRIGRSLAPSSGIPFVTGLLATSYQIGAALGHLLGGVAASRFGPRWSFAYPLVLYAPLLMLAWRPLVGYDTGVSGGTVAQRSLSGGPGREIWVLGLVLSLVNILRYGLLLWLPSLLVTAAGLRAELSALLSSAIVLFGVLGTVATGWWGRRLDAARLRRMCIGLLVLLATACAAVNMVLHVPVVLVATLSLASAIIYSVHSLCVATFPATLSARGHTGSAAGTVDSLGYVGVASASILMGALADRGGWPIVTTLWSLSALVASLLLVWSRGRVGLGPAVGQAAP